MAQEEVKYNEYSPTEQWSPAGNLAKFNANIVTINNQYCGSAYGTKVVSSGKYQWTIKSTFSSTSCQWIGVSTDFTILNSTFATKPNAILWCNHCRHIQGNVGSGTGYTNLVAVKPSEYWNSGDCITIKLDLDSNTIAWYRNSNEKPHATYSNLPKGKYKIAVYGQPNNAFEIVSSTGDGLPILSIEDKIFPLIKNSMDDLKHFEAKIKKLDTTNLLKSKNGIKKFNYDYEIMLKRFADYVDILKKADMLITNELNPSTTDYKTWNLKKVIRYICSLENGKFVKYKTILETNMAEQEFAGKDLQHVEKNDLLGFGIKNFGDRGSLYRAIQKLVHGSPQNEGNNTSHIIDI